MASDIPRAVTVLKPPTSGSDVWLIATAVNSGSLDEWRSCFSEDLDTCINELLASFKPATRFEVCVDDELSFVEADRVFQRVKTLTQDTSHSIHRRKALPRAGRSIQEVVKLLWDSPVAASEL